MPSTPPAIYVTAHCPREVESGIACECDLEIPVWCNGDWQAEDFAIPSECGEGHALTEAEQADVLAQARHRADEATEAERNCRCRPGRPCDYHYPD